MNRVFALFGFVAIGICTACGGSSGEATSLADESRPALEAAQRWLTALDSANYDETWSQAATVFRTANGSPANWASAAGEMRGPLGAVASRRVREVAPTHLQAGAGYTFAFDSAFDARPNVTEEVTVLLEGGFWRVAGYLLR